jgi:hypothetical protein
MPSDVQPTLTRLPFTEFGLPRLGGGAPDDGGDGGDGGEGQGDPGEGGLYDLDSVPQELRSHVEPILREMEGNVTRRFQQRADELREWEPYQELGVHEIDPAELERLLTFAEMAQDPDQFSNWWRTVGQQMGLSLDEGGDGTEDFSDDELDDLTPEQVQELIAEQVAEKISPIEAALQENAYAQAEQEAMADISDQLGQLVDEHGDELDTDAILQLAYAYVDEDPDGAIQRGFEDYQKLVSNAGADLFDRKVKQPKTPEGRGATDHSPDRITSFADAKAAGLERLRAAQTA